MTVEEVPTMPLNCRPPVPVPAPAPVLAPSALPVPVPREGAATRVGRGAPPLSSYTGRARVLFWSVGGLTATGGSSVDATFCACASVALRARKVVARKTARCQPVPIFRSSHSLAATVLCELRKARGTGKFMILVLLIDLKSLV